jgi:hypothetical protein
MVVQPGVMEIGRRGLDLNGELGDLLMAEVPARLGTVKLP